MDLMAYQKLWQQQQTSTVIVEKASKNLQYLPQLDLTLLGFEAQYYIRTVSSYHLLSAVLDWFTKTLKWFIGHLGRATCTVHSMSAQTSQEGIKSTKIKKHLGAYYPN